MAVMVGRSAERTWLAFWLRTCRAADPISAKRSAETRRPPSFVPRAFAAARAALVLFEMASASCCNGGQDVDHEPIRLRHIDRHKFNARLHEVRDEGDVAGEAIKLGD